MAKVTLCRSELNRINDALLKFPDAKQITIKSVSESGIGNCTYLSFIHPVNDVLSKVTITITDVDSW